MNFQFRYGASRRTMNANFDASRSHSAVNSSSNLRMGATSAASGFTRAMMRTKGSVTAEMSRLTGIGQFGRRRALRVSGFTRQGTGPTFGQRSFWRSRKDDSERPRPSEAPTCWSQARNSTSPRPWRCRSGATMTSMPQDASIS